MTLHAELDRTALTIVDTLERYPWKERDAYASFLAQTFYYTRHSTKLLTLASSRFSFDDYDLHRRFIAHSQEERGHEFMCQKDLSSLGYDWSKMAELPATAAFYQRQYYLIEHVDPIAFMGYVLCLEGMSSVGAGQVMAKVGAMHAANAVLFLRAHAGEDHDHTQKALTAVGKLAPSRLEIVRENLAVSCRLYCDLLEACGKSSVTHAKRQATALSA